MNKDNPHIGSSLDEFLDESGIREDVEILAARKVIALRLVEALERQDMTKTELARRMHTSRTVVNRMLDPDNPGITLQTIDRASRALGLKLKVELVEA